MTQQFEDFVNAALDKSLASDVTLPTANKIPVYTGIGRQVTGKTPAELGLAVSSDITAINSNLALKADLVDGVVPANQLPSYVDDVLEFANLASFPVTGESGKVYVAIDTKKTYRWSGSTYVQIGSDLALGETPSTAYRGDRGKTAYDHSQATGNPHSTTKGDIGLGNVDNTSDANKPISTATQTALNYKEPTLANVITAATYGSATQYPVITFNAKGIATGVTLQTVSVAEVSDSVFRVVDNSDATKKLAFEASGIATGQTRTITMPDMDVDLGAIGATKVYTADVPYRVGELVYHQNETWRVLVAHTGAIPFVNGNLELVGDVLNVFTTSTPYVAQRLGVEQVALNRVAKTLVVNFHVNSALAINISEAPFRVIIRNGMTNSSKTLTITKTHATNNVQFFDETSVDITATTGTTATYSITLAPGGEVELLNLSYQALVYLRKQNTIGRFKLSDVSSTLDADRNRGWLFNGSATDARTITLPDKNIDFGDLPSVATNDTNSIALAALRCRILGGSGNTVSGTDNVAIACNNINMVGTSNTAISCAGSATPAQATEFAGTGNTFTSCSGYILGTGCTLVSYSGFTYYANLRAAYSALVVPRHSSVVFNTFNELSITSGVYANSGASSAVLADANGIKPVMWINKSFGTEVSEHIVKIKASAGSFVFYGERKVLYKVGDAGTPLVTTIGTDIGTGGMELTVSIDITATGIDNKDMSITVQNGVAPTSWTAKIESTHF